MRYVSTRGDAPSLSFVEATLAGLARDGGLYVPETWPQLDRDTIAGFAGKPYAEVAADVISQFAGDAKPTTRSAIRQWRRSRNLGLAHSCSSFFTAPRSPSRIWRCSSWGG